MLVSIISFYHYIEFVDCYVTYPIVHGVGLNKQNRATVSLF